MNQYNLKLDDLLTIINEHFEYNGQTGGFYDASEKSLMVDFNDMSVYKLFYKDGERVDFIPADLFLDVLRKTEDSYYKIFQDS